MDVNPIGMNQKWNLYLEQSKMVFMDIDTNNFDGAVFGDCIVEHAQEGYAAG